MPDPPPLPLPEPPTASTLASARADLAATHAALATLTAQVSAAESDLARLVAAARASIADLDAQRAALELRAAHARAYVAPVRRLPQELLRQVFLMNWEEYPCCAWVLAAVCTTWRRLALSTPVIWSKVRRRSRAGSFPLAVLGCGHALSFAMMISSCIVTLASHRRPGILFSWAYLRMVLSIPKDTRASSSGIAPAACSEHRTAPDRIPPCLGSLSPTSLHIWVHC